MIPSLMTGTFDLTSFIVSLLLSMPIALLALSVHETAHGFVAYKLGDPTAYNFGRLSLNPLKHVDPIGFGCMVLFGFGWAKPVPVDTRYFKKPKRDMALTGAAGPISNLLLALLFAVLLRVELEIAMRTSVGAFASQALWWLQIFLIKGIQLNIGLAVFNLIPVPPFDGSRIFLTLLPTNLYFKIMKYEKYLYIVLMIALLVGLLDRPLDLVSDWFMNIILGIAF
ncbi:MAG: site-2 protease family protein [Ruminococcaceae bacterium]|nr:site-2 protease family protein [Oscillospiraceae bacterium]